MYSQIDSRGAETRKRRAFLDRTALSRKISISLFLSVAVTLEMRYKKIDQVTHTHTHNMIARNELFTTCVT